MSCDRTKLRINKKSKGLPREELEKLSKNALIDKIVQLEAHNFQLKNLLQKKLCELEGTRPGNTNPKLDIEATHGNERPAKKRNFDFSKAHKRHVLLKVLYFGWDYQGLACQEDTNDTIEHYLFQALARCCLIESRTTSNYHRCGRTDKGVSAFCQVISIDLRSKFPVEDQLKEESLAAEIDYCGLLNRILPANIQCLGWMPLKSRTYSARFDCVGRTYRYYFPAGDLNVDAMNKACKLLIHHGDFRNFCKMDVNNGVTNYIRNLQNAHIERCSSEHQGENIDGYSMFYLEIKANAFLWHQIRCIMAVLLLVGEGKESPEVITELLDVEKNPCKPQYMPANGLPLNLFHCEFRSKAKGPDDSDAFTTSAAEDYANEDTTHWIYSRESLQKLIETLQSQWSEFSIKTSMIRDVLLNVETLLSETYQELPIKAQAYLLQNSAPRVKQYQKLLDRKRCESLENRIDHFVKKRRLVVETDAPNAAQPEIGEQIEEDSC